MTLEINPNDWFVNPSMATNGNKVTCLIDGIETMTAINEQLNNLTTGDFCYYGGWQMSPDLSFPGPTTSTLLEQFTGACNRGADMRLLLFQQLGPGIVPGGLRGVYMGSAGDHKNLLRELGSLSNPAQVIIDTKHPTVGSHHQKYCVFGKNQSGKFVLTAFCGGIDLANGRGEDQSHNFYLLFQHTYRGWHDIHSKIEGPAAETILNDFIRRWEAHDHTVGATSYKTATTSISITANDVILGPYDESFTHQVEVLHTYACLPTVTTEVVWLDKTDVYVTEGLDYGYPFAKQGTTNGITTIREGYIKAIGMAEYYIYIETPFLSDEEIVKALTNKLNQKQVTVILVMPYLTGYAFYEEQSIRSIRQATYGASFHACDLRHPDGTYQPPSPPVINYSYAYPDGGYQWPIYVHSKIMIVDDRYVTVGSANLNLRSMVHDSEINVAVIDEDVITDGELGVPVSKMARAFRIRLWEEHLGFSNLPLDDIPTALNTWITNINDPALNLTLPPSRIFKHDPTAIGPTDWSFSNLVAEREPNCSFHETVYENEP